jgi:predicted RNase H-like HicB family nuclease
MVRKTSAHQTVDVQTKYGLFSVSLERDGIGYAVSVARIPEIATFGKTLLDAKRMAKEAIEVAIEGEVLSRAEKRGTIKFSRNARRVFA